MVLEELGKLFGGEGLAVRIEENESVGGTGAAFFAQFEESGLVGKGQRFNVGVARDALEVLGGERLDGWIFGFADPGDF